MFARKTFKCIDIHPSSFVHGNLSRNGAAGAELPGGGVQLVHDTRLAALDPPHLRCLHSCHPCQSGIMPPQVTTPWSWVSRLVYQAHLSGDKPRVLLLELGQVADVAGVLLHQVVAS